MRYLQQVACDDESLGATSIKPRHPPGPPMTLGNMRELGVHALIGYCLNDACWHQALIDVSTYPVGRHCGARNWT